MISDREERAARRAEWTGAVVERETPAQRATPEERLATMWELAVDGWALRGEPIASYRRGEAPGRVIRPR